MKNYLTKFLILFLIFVVPILIQQANSQNKVETGETYISVPVNELLAGEEDQMDQIEKALPKKATVVPKKKRHLLIFDYNVNYGGHRSINYASYAFARMGKETGAYETIISRDTNVFRAENLEKFDAVFFNNTVGNLFQDKKLRQNLLDFVYAGGGLLGVHATTAAFTKWPGQEEDWPEFGIMIGARGASHRENDEHVFMDLEEPNHSVTRVFEGNAPDYKDEFFRFRDPYSRDLVRVLLSIDTVKTDMNQGRSFGRVKRADHDYPVAWVRQYGRGRVFYSTIAHHPAVFWDPIMLEFYLDAVQFTLGDTEGPALPSGKLTPAIRAQEKMDWKLGIEAYTFKDNTFFETIDKTAELGLLYVGGLNVQKVSDKIPKNFDYHLSDEELMEVRNKLISKGISMLTYFIFDIPGDEATVKQIFEFGRKMGIETFISEPKPENLDLIEKYCEKYDIKLALHNHAKRLSPIYYDPEKLMDVVKDRSPLIGAAGDFGYWVREGFDPYKAIKTLGERLITLQIHDLNDKSSEAHDVPWGTGTTDLDNIFDYLKKEKIKPVMFGLEYSRNWNHSTPEIVKSINYFNDKTIEMGN